MLVSKILAMTEQIRNLSPRDYAIQTGNKIIGIDAFQDYLRRRRETGHSVSLEQKFIAALFGLGQIAMPWITQDIIKMVPDHKKNFFEKPFLRAMKYSSDIVCGTPIGALLVVSPELSLTMLLVGAKLAYNGVAAVLPDATEGVLGKGLPGNK